MKQTLSAVEWGPRNTDKSSGRRAAARQVRPLHNVPAHAPQPIYLNSRLLSDPELNLTPSAQPSARPHPRPPANHQMAPQILPKLTKGMSPSPVAPLTAMATCGTDVNVPTKVPGADSSQCTPTHWIRNAAAAPAPPIALVQSFVNNSSRRGSQSLRSELLAGSSVSNQSTCVGTPHHPRATAAPAMSVAPQASSTAIRIGPAPAPIVSLLEVAAPRTLTLPVAQSNEDGGAISNTSISSFGNRPNHAVLEARPPMAPLAADRGPNDADSDAVRAPEPFRRSHGVSTVVSAPTGDGKSVGRFSDWGSADSHSERQPTLSQDGSLGVSSEQSAATEVSSFSGSHSHQAASIAVQAKLPPPPTITLSNLTAYEKEEIKSYLPAVYFTGTIPAKQKIQGKCCAAGASESNDNYDDDNNHYIVTVGDHLAYRYEVTAELGRGTFGVVVAAVDHKSAAGSGRRVAIKLIRNKPAYAKQAKEEARLLQQLVDGDPEDAANVVRLHDTFTFRNHYALVFERMDGDLYGYMQANQFRPFSQRFIYNFAEQALRSLAYLSLHGVIHCDLKPENIVIEQKDSARSMNNGADRAAGQTHTSSAPKQQSEAGLRRNELACSRFKVIDFGSSCTPDKRAYTYIQSRYYRAPEIVLGIPYTTAIDMWSFGCILCELANGLPIFPATGEGELLERITEYLGPVPDCLVSSGRRSDRFFAKCSVTEADAGLAGSYAASEVAERSFACAARGAGSTDAAKTLPTYSSRPPRMMLPSLSKKGRARKPPRSRQLRNFLKFVATREGDEEAELFLDFVGRCLEYDPRRRLTPHQALEHRWIQRWRTATTAEAPSWLPST